MDPALPPERVLGKVIASAVVLALASVVFAAGPPRPHYMFVDEALAKHPTVPVRVHGYVKPGTLLHQTDAMHRLTLTHDGGCLDTELFGTLPDTVRDDSEIVVDGRMQQQADGRWVLIGTQIWAKCAANYDGGRGRIDAEFK